MALQAPNLDDRKFQDIVSEARSKIPTYCPEWTDYNLSDPGVTLIELFAWMTDMILYRLNRVPEKNYIKFMELIGLKLEPPRPARADITFRLAAPQPQAVTIPPGTEVGTVRTETEESIVFTTDAPLTIGIPDHVQAMTTPDGSIFNDCLAALKISDSVAVSIFEPVPRENNALYLGYVENLRAHVLMLTIECGAEGIGIDPRKPPLIWEYRDSEDADGEKWRPLKLETDTTGGFNTTGQVILHIPVTAITGEVAGKHAFWIRCRATAPPKQRYYAVSPKIESIKSQSVGGIVPASQCLRIRQEILGRSDGTPGQKFNLRHFPVLFRQPDEVVETETDNEGIYEVWREVTDFADSGPEDRHFSLDSVTGEVQFGPVIRQPSGEERRYGRVPPPGRQVRFTSYRWGGGVVGNVGEHTLTVLRSSIPYVSAVTNYLPAIGGVNAETLERAKIRAPGLLRARTRAVTADDFEYLALESSSEIARARCLTADTPFGNEKISPGVVRLILIPKINVIGKPVPFEQLTSPASVTKEVQNYLDERRLLGTRLEILPPEYVAVAVELKIKVAPGASTEAVVAEIKRKLYRFINPITGGSEATGWPFGRSLFATDVFGLVQQTAGIDYVDGVQLYIVDTKRGERRLAGSRVTVPPQGLVCSAEHEVLVIKGD
jgi:predicted phage baseplate assembly protein